MGSSEMTVLYMKKESLLEGVVASIDNEIRNTNGWVILAKPTKCTVGILWAPVVKSCALSCRCVQRASR